MKYIIFFLISFNLFATEKVVVIQSISIQEKTFVISLGKKDGIQEGQESLFSTEHYSVAARAQKASRNFSLWKVTDPHVKVPFIKDEFVIYDNNIDNIYNQVPFLRERMKTFVFNPQRYYKFKTHFSQTLAESLSDTDEEINATRRGYQLEFIFEKEWNSFLSWGAGARYDSEIQTLGNPALEIPTKRLFAVAEINYNFAHFEESKNNLYASAGIGWGTTESIVDERTATGTAWAIPVIRLGIQNNDFDQIKYMFEISFEAIFVEEVFPDGQRQSTNLTNGKVGFGIKF